MNGGLSELTLVVNMVKSCEKEACKGKVSGKNKLCDKCNKSESAAAAEAGVVKTIKNELLMCTEWHRQCSTREVLENVLSGHFSAEHVDEVRSCLVSELDDLGFFHSDIHKQRQMSNNRTEVMVMSGDIIKALEDLERNHIEIDFVAENWDILPKYKPEESTNLSIAERMAELEAKFTTQSQILS